MDQYWKFTQSDAEKNEFYRQVGTRMVTLRMSSCLQKIDLRQDKVEEITKHQYDTTQQVTKWYDDF